MSERACGRVRLRGLVVVITGAIGLLVWMSAAAHAATGFSDPTGIAVDASGDYFVADTGNNCVVEVHPDGTETTIGSEFSQPTAVGVDGADDVFVADANGVEEVKPSGAQIMILPGVSPNGQGLAVDRSGDVFISTENGILEVKPDGTRITIGSGNVGAIAVDPSGNLFVDNGTEVEKIAPDGAETALVINWQPIVDPVGIAVNDADDVFVTDLDNVDDYTSYGLIEIPADGGGADYQIGDFSPVDQPYGLAANASGDVFVTFPDQGIVKEAEEEGYESQSINWPQQGPIVYGQSTQLTANASSGLPVTYSVTSGPCSVSGSTLTTTGVGPCVIVAAQPGGTNYLPADTVSQAITINRAPTTLTVAPVSTSELAKATFSATLTSAVTGAPVGGQTVAFTFNNSTLCEATTNSSGLASCTEIGITLSLPVAEGFSDGSLVLAAGPSYTAKRNGSVDYLASDGIGRL